MEHGWLYNRSAGCDVSYSRPDRLPYGVPPRFFADAELVEEVRTLGLGCDHRAFFLPSRRLQGSRSVARPCRAHGPDPGAALRRRGDSRRGQCSRRRLDRALHRTRIRTDPNRCRRPAAACAGRPEGLRLFPLRRDAWGRGVSDARAYCRRCSLVRHSGTARRFIRPPAAAQVRFCLCHERSSGLRMTG